MNKNAARLRNVGTCYSSDEANLKQNHSANMKMYWSAAVL
jgi:hypothetical protein